MGTVSIHLNQDVVLTLQAPGEAREVRRSQPSFARPMEHMNGRITLSERVGEGTCAVGGIVIRNQHVGIRHSTTQALKE
jgi:hypothetical protein